MKYKKIMTKEARLPVMWAIDFRDMHTAIHGLFYGKDRREVERFAKELEYIVNDCKDVESDEYPFLFEELYADFPGIQRIDEINFRDIGKLPSGKYGIIIDDVEYRLVNNVAIDLYEESKKVVQESDEGNSDHPRIYVGTYAKYNDGSIDGKWIDISEYNTYEEFVDACRELHKDEKDPEFMVQDFENYPKKWYHETGLPTEEEFEKINEFYLMDDSRKDAYEAFVNYTGDDDIEKFEESYECEYTSDSDFGYHLIDEFGFEGIQNLDYYFDYDSFGRDLMMDYSMGDEDEEDAEGNPQDPDHYYDQDGYDMGEYESDTKVAEDFVDSMGGVDALGKETAQNYFDYEAFGRDCLINDFFVSDGYVFRNY